MTTIVFSTADGDEGNLATVQSDGIPAVGEVVCIHPEDSVGLAGFYRVTERAWRVTGLRDMVVFVTVAPAAP